MLFSVLLEVLSFKFWGFSFILFWVAWIILVDVNSVFTDIVLKILSPYRIILIKLINKVTVLSGIYLAA